MGSRRLPPEKAAEKRYEHLATEVSNCTGAVHCALSAAREAGAIASLLRVRKQLEEGPRWRNAAAIDLVDAELTRLIGGRR